MPRRSPSSPLSEHAEKLREEHERIMREVIWPTIRGLAADGNAAPGLELLIDRLKTFKNNADFLTEIAKQPTS